MFPLELNQRIDREKVISILLRSRNDDVNMVYHSTLFPEFFLSGKSTFEKISFVIL